MKGSPVFYRVPSSEGWRLLQGTIANITPSALVVCEKQSGRRQTINPNWLVCYDWSQTKTAAA